MNLSQLQSYVSYALDDLQFGYFTIPQVTQWINNGQNELQKRLLKAGNNRYTVTVTTPLVINQMAYALPPDFKKLHNLEVVITGTAPNESTNPVSPITENQKYLVQNGAGTPNFYVIKKNALVLYPASDGTAPILRMTYSYMVPDLVNLTDVPDAPSDYHELIGLLAIEQGLLKDGRASPYIEKKIDAIQKSIDSDAQERTQDQPRGVVETGSGSDAGFFWIIPFIIFLGSVHGILIG